ncbi:MAG: DUF1631 domain-containing protein [Thiohalocapsa sp.]
MTASGKAKASTRAAHEAAFQRCRERVLAFCDKQLNELFAHAGTVLLDFAERAESNSVQGRFFEAISHLTRNQDEMTRRYLEEVDRGFAQFGPKTKPGSNVANPEDELSLIAPDEMEEWVATENIIIKANANLAAELYALIQRFAALSDGETLRDNEVPGGPEQLVKALRESLRVSNVDINTKVILCALFDKLCMGKAQPLYQELNDILKDDGVLPHIRSVNPKRAPEAEKVAEAANGKVDAQTDAEEHRIEASSPQASTTSLSDELFDTILELMATRRRGDQSSAQGVGRAPLPVARPRVISAFERVRSEQPPRPLTAPMSAPQGVSYSEAEERFLGDIKHALHDEREQVLDALGRDELHPVDTDVIDLIGMLFECMLNDPLLPNSAKALISHLHTPYLKLALIDRRLLVDKEHPARQLMDEMVEAGGLWVDDSNPNRGIFPHIQRTVDRIQKDFSEDVSLFDELLGEFRSAVEEQRSRSGNMEQRNQEAARGRERLRLAKLRAAKEIQTLAQGQTLPEPVLAFLRRTWIDVLAFLVLRHGADDDSDAWKDAVGTAEQLIGLFNPEPGNDDLDERIAAATQLRDRISAGVRSMGSYNHALLDALNSLLGDPRKWRDQGHEDRSANADPSILASDDTAMSAEYRTPETLDTSVASQAGEDETMIEHLRKLKPGVWFEFRVADDSAPRRAKLSWMSFLTSNCMFVDRSGMQSEMKNLHDLAREIADGRARLIEEQAHPFIERAMHSIRRLLSESEAEAPDIRNGAPPKPPNI